MLDCWTKEFEKAHCVKSVQIRSFFWSVFGHFLRSSFSSVELKLHLKNTSCVKLGLFRYKIIKEIVKINHTMQWKITENWYKICICQIRVRISRVRNVNISENFVYVLHELFLIGMGFLNQVLLNLCNNV